METTTEPEEGKFHALLTRVLVEPDVRLTADEAGEVWHAMYRIVKESAVPEAGIIQCLYDHLARELHRGKRCAVCGKYEDPSCVLGC